MTTPAARCRALAALLGAAVAAVAPAPGRAATFNWRGNGGNNDWGNAANWQENAAPTNDGTADLIFGATAAVFPSIFPDYSIRSLAFSAGASAYTFDSGPLTLNAGGLTQNGPLTTPRCRSPASSGWARPPSTSAPLARRAPSRSTWPPAAR